MNFLAHLYLSGDDPKIKTGNFIGDFVKGRNLHERFEYKIIKGIELHRTIDDFTDKHNIVHISKKRLQPKYRHYASVIIDIYYDHFLATNWNLYSNISLEDFAKDAYETLTLHNNILPDEAKYMLPYMISGNWLLNYQYIEGIHKALSGMARRTTFLSKMEEASVDLKMYYNEFESEFKQFFPDLQKICESFLVD